MRRVFRTDDGAASLLPLLLWVVILLAVAVLEIGAHLVTRAQAANLADAGALAAVTSPDAPHPEARRIVEAGGGRLEACRCPRGSATAEVTVSLPVPSSIRLSGATPRQHATAAALLTHGAHSRWPAYPSHPAQPG